MSFPIEKLIEKEQRQQFWRRLFRRVFLEDWGTKLIALAISVALWLGVTGLRAPIEVNLRQVPLVVRIPNDMEITSAPQDIEISITGDSRKLAPLEDRVKSRDLVASIDLTDVNSGDRTVLLSPETVDVELPSGVKLSSIQPSKILVKLEKVIEKEVDVSANIQGILAENQEIYSISIVPAKVRVRGAESALKALDSISTEPINAGDFKEGANSFRVGLNALNPKITIFDAIVDVGFRVGEKRSERLFIVPFKTEHETKSFSVLLYGGQSLIEKLRTDELQIELQKGENGENVPRLILPAGLQDKIEIRRIKPHS